MRIKVIPIFIALSALSMSACDSKTAEEYIAAAETQYLQNDTQAAIIDLKNAIALAPKNKEARANLGKYYLTAGLFVESEKELRKALELGESKDSVYPALVRAIYYQNDFDRLTRLTQDYTSENTQIQSSVALFTFLANLKNTDTDSTLDTDFSALLGDDKILAQVYYEFSQGKFSQADELLSSFQQPEQNKIEKLIVTGLLKAQLEDFDLAIEALDQVVASSPEYYVVQFQLAEVLIKAKEFEKAKKLVDELLKINSRSAYANLLIAQIFIHDENYKKAFDAAEIAIQNGIDSTQSNLLAGISAYKIERTESAYKYLSKASRNISPNHMANRLLAEVKIKLGETDNLAEMLEGISGQDAQKSALLEGAAMIKFREGDIEASKSLFSQAKEGDPGNAVTLLREGLIKLSSGDQSGIDSLESAVALDNTLGEAWSLLAQGHIQAHEPKKALAVAKRWQEVNEVDGLVLESYILQQLDDDVQARIKLDKALELAPKNYAAMRFLMLMNAREKRFDEARALAETLLTSTENLSGKFQLVFTLINLAIEQDDLASAETLLQSLLSQQTDSSDKHALPISVGLATIYNYRGEFQKALSLLTDLHDTNDFYVLSTLGQTYSGLNDFNNAKSTFQALINAFPRDMRSWNKLITLLNQYGLNKEAVDVATRGESALPHDPRLTVLNIRSLIRAGDIHKAQQKIDKMKAQGNSSPMFELFAGEMALHHKEYEKAHKYLSQYYAVDPSWDSAKPLAEALAHLGKAVEGGKYLEAQTAKTRDKLKNIHYITEYYSRGGELDKAAQYYKALMDINPKDFITLNNYSAVAIKQGEITLAIELAQKALQLSPESPFAMDTLGWALFHDKKYGDALTYIKKAHEAIPKNNEVTFHLIETLIATGSKDKAKSLLGRIKPTNDSDKQTLARLNASI